MMFTRERLLRTLFGTPKRAIGTLVGVVFVIVVIAAVSAAGSGGSDVPAQDTTKTNAESVNTESAEDKENRRKGFHCLSTWDGNHDGFEDIVRKELNDPGSMETIETGITPANNQGQHTIRMEFTAKNAFGGRVRHEARGLVDNDTCEATLLSIQ